MLLLLHELTHTGAPRLALRTFAELLDAIELRVVAREPGPLSAGFAELGPISILSRRVPAPPRDLRSWPRKQLIRFSLRRWQPDLIYANSVLSLPLVRRLRLPERPVILHVHELTVALDTFETVYPGLIRSIPDAYIAVSNAVAAGLASGCGVPNERIRVVPPFVDVPTPPTRRHSGPPWVVGGIGNPSWTKGLSLWLLAARAIADRTSPGGFRFRWVGVRDNLEGRQFRAMAHKLGLADIVEFVPEIPDATSHLGSFDVLAMTSWEEAASLVVLEAMSLGIPVVCFEGSGGPREEVGDAGIVLASFSPVHMAEAIIELVKQPARLDAIASAARNRISRSFTRAATVPIISEEIERLSQIWRVT